MDQSFISSYLEHPSQNNTAFLFHPIKSSFLYPGFKITTPKIMLRPKNAPYNNELIVHKLPEVFMHNRNTPTSVDDSDATSSRMSRDSRLQAQKHVNAQKIKDQVNVIQEKEIESKIKQFTQDHELSMRSRAQAQKQDLQEKLQETKHMLIKVKRVI